MRVVFVFQFMYHIQLQSEQVRNTLSLSDPGEEG